MGSPRYTDEGVKVVIVGFDYYCGHCNNFLANNYGFEERFATCSKCGMHNRFSNGIPDLASERLSDLALMLEKGAQRHDSIIMMDAAAEIRNIIRDVKKSEEYERDFFAPVAKMPAPSRDVPSATMGVM